MGYGVDFSNSILNKFSLGTRRIYGYFCGGEEAAYITTIDVFNMTTAGNNASDTGDLTQARVGATGLSSQLYGFICGGNYTSIDYIDLTLLTQNATAGGSCLNRSIYAGQGGVHCDSNIYGYIASQTNRTNNIIERLDMTIITSNAIDNSDLTAARQFLTGV